MVASPPDHRAPFASDPARSRGRRLPEPPDGLRTPFQRDRDRIVHSTAFRRLMHKTQVFIAGDDHFRTRLTHSLEVAQIARSMARLLGLDEDLAEGIALAHDFGHTPFGHVGEDVLDPLMADHGGFDHNAQTYRIVTRLERRYAAFDGLNLTRETLEGLVKHNGPVMDRSGAGLGAYASRPLPAAFTAGDGIADLRPWEHAGPEAQVAALADDIAYDCHDIDDGLRARLLGFERLREVPFLASLLDEIRGAHGEVEPARRVNELVRRLMTRMILDAVEETRRRVASARVASAEEVRQAGMPVVAFAEPMRAVERRIKTLLFGSVYRDPAVLAARDEAATVVRALFEAYVADQTLLPAPWRQGLEEGDERRLFRRVCDYISGMTDRFALEQHQRVVGPTPAALGANLSA